MKIERNIEYKGIVSESSPKDSWADQVIPQALENKYYTSGRTGAEAMIAFWQDVADGKYMDICNEFQIPNHLGLVHSASTWAKELIISGRILIKKD